MNMISLRSPLPDYSLDDGNVKSTPHRTYNPRLESYLRFALDTLEEYDLPYPGEDTLLVVLQAVLDARVLIVQASDHPRTPSELAELLRKLLVFALQPTSELEVI
jgi:hypothetical protein